MTNRDWHGTPGGYKNHACRCAECREANAESQRRWRKHGTSRQEGAIDRLIAQVENAPSWKEWKAGL